MPLTATQFVIFLAAAGLGARQVSSLKAPTFEVASVKQSLRSELGQSYRFSESGAFTATNVPLRRLIGFAYGVPSLPSLEKHLLTGGTARVLESRFDISAKPADSVSREQGLLMLRTLLADRFHLRIRSESRPVQTYTLMIPRNGKLGPNIVASKYNCREYLSSRAHDQHVEEPLDAKGNRWCAVNPYAGGEELLFKNAGTIDDLVRDLVNIGGLDQPLVNGTDLKGNFEWTLTVPWLGGGNTMAQVPSLVTSLSDQLGFRVEVRRAPTAVWVIDSVSMPTPN